MMFHVSLMVSTKQNPIVENTKDRERILRLPLQKIRLQRESAREQRRKALTKQPENNQENSSKSIPNDYFKWTKFSDQKTEWLAVQLENSQI